MPRDPRNFIGLLVAIPDEGRIMTGSADDPLARDVRKYVFDHFLEQAVPPVLEQIMERYHLDRVEAFAILKGLEDARHLKLVPGTQRILMAFPFSAVATPFRVTRPVIGRRYYANCAWDAVAFHSMLHEIIRSTVVAIIALSRFRLSSPAGNRAQPLPHRLSISPYPRPSGGMTSSSPARITWCSSPASS